MALEDYNKQLVERFETLISHIEADERDDALAVVEQLASEQFDDDDLPKQLEALRDGRDLADVRAWAERLLNEIQRPANSFDLGDFDFDLDGAFLELEDTGFRDIGEKSFAAPQDLLDAVDGADSIDVASEIALVEHSDEVEDLEIDSMGSIEDLSDEVSEDTSDVDANAVGSRHVLSGRFNLPPLPDSAVSDDVAPGGKQDTAEDPQSEEVGHDPSEADENSMLSVMHEASSSAGGAGAASAAGHSLVDAFADLESVADVVPQSPSSFGDSAPSLDFGDLDDADESAESVEGEASDPASAVANPEDIRRTRPNVVPEAIATGKDEDPPDGRPEFHSGSSQARYASRNEPPPPPVHRLQGSADISGEIPMAEPEVEDDSDPVDFDLGLRNPVHHEPPPVARGFDFDFDSELSSADETSDGDRAPTFQPSLDDSPPLSPPTVEAEIDDDVDDLDLRVESESRERQHTPLAPLPAADLENDFFDLAASMAAEGDQPYRGEPLRPRAGSGNPFAHEAPTGTNHPAVGGNAAKSFMGGDEDLIATNLNAILLEARRLKRRGELGAALDITKKVLSRSDNAAAEELQREIEEELEAAHLDAIGPLAQTPTLRIKMSQLSNLDLDHRAGFIISQIDGMLTYEDIIELSSMSRQETLHVLCSLIDKGVIDSQ